MRPKRLLRHESGEDERTFRVTLVRETQRVGHADGRQVDDAWSRPQKDYGMSPTTQSKHRSAGKLQIVSCTSKKLGRMCATQECRGIPRR